MTPLFQNVFIGRQNFIADFEFCLRQIQEDQGQILSIEGPLGIGTSSLLKRHENILKQQQHIFFKASLKPNSQDPLECFRLWAKQIAQQSKKNNIHFTPTEDHILLSLYKPEQQKALPYSHTNEFIEAALHTLKMVFQRFSNHALVFIVEDLHFAHQSTYKYLNTMFENFENHKTLLLYTQTPQDNLPWHKDLNFNQQILPKFNSDEVLDFCQQHLQADYIAPSVIKVLLEHSKGNPLYLEKLLKHALITNYIQVITHQGKTSIVLNEIKHSIPKDLSALLLTPFYKLPALGQSMLNHIAVFGYEGHVDILEAYLNNIFHSDVQDLFKKLFDEHFLDITSSFPNKIYQFNHGLFYELLHQQLTIEKRCAIHHSIASFLIQYQKNDDFEDLTFKIAYHAQNTSDDCMKTAYSYLAGLKTFDRHQFQETLFHLSQIKHTIHYLNRDQQENFVVIYAKSLIASESLEHAQSFIKQSKKNLSFDKPVFAYLEAEIAHHQNQYKQMIHKTNHLNIANKALQTHFEDLLPMRLKSLLNEGLTESTVFEGFSALRALQLKNDDNKPELQANIWCKLILANNYSRKTSLTPAFIYCLSLYPINTFSIKSLIEINNDINRWYISSGQYAEALLNVSKTINLCDQHYLVNQKYQSIFSKGLIHSYIGNFSLALECYNTSTDELYKLKNYRQSYNAFLYYIDCLMDQGRIKQAQCELKKLSRYKNLNKSDMNLAIEYILTGLYAFYSFDFKLAEKDFLKSMVHYQNANFTRAAFKCQARALIMQTLIPKANINALEKNYKDLHRSLHKNTLDISCTIYLLIAYYYASIHIQDLPPPKEFIEPKSIQDSYTKQWLYVAKINLLKHSGKTNQAQQYIDEYRKSRDEMAFNIHDQFKEEFMNHPIFKVPELN